MCLSVFVFVSCVPSLPLANKSTPLPFQKGSTTVVRCAKNRLESAANVDWMLGCYFLCFVRTQRHTQIIALGLQMMIGTHSQPSSVHSYISFVRPFIYLTRHHSHIAGNNRTQLGVVLSPPTAEQRICVEPSNMNAKISLFIYLRCSILRLIV